MTMNVAPAPDEARLDERGFTLVELMIALVLFSFAVAGVLSVAVSITRGYREQRQAINAEAAVRAPIDFLADALRQASPGVSDPSKITDYHTCKAGAITVDTFQTTRIYDRDGDLLLEVDNPDYGWRSFVGLDQVSPSLVDATVSAEDSTFWTNAGIDPVGIVRAVVINVSGSGSSGASTITQQLVGALYPDQINRFDISYSRKVREAMAAVALN